MSNDFPFNHFINLDTLKNKENLSNNNNIQDYNFPEVNLDKQVTPKQTGHSLSSSEFDSDELKMLSDEILKGIKNNVSVEKYKAYFENTLKVTDIRNQTIYMSVTTQFIKNMIDSYYLESVKQIIFNTLGTQYQVVIELMSSQVSENTTDISALKALLNKGEEESNSKSKLASASEYSFKLNTEPVKDITAEIESAEIKHHVNEVKNKRFDFTKTFDNFVVGASNNMAHAFTKAVAEDPGKVYPQLYLYGNSGLGKTHLLHATCNHITQTRPYVRICFTSANEFMSEMVMAIQSTTGKDNKINDFRRKYTELVDVLIIDDIHELKNKTRTQAEFFHIFNDLQNRGKQLIFTSDKPPKEIIGIEDRIRTRLSSALLIDIQQPDLETRIAILKKKSIEKDIFLDDEVINLIAKCVKSNVRELEGKLIKLGAYSDLMNVDIDLEIAKEQLNLNELMEEKILNIESITKVISSYYKITLGDVKGKSRKKEVVLARHIAMYMSHKILKKTLEEIGEFFDNRDHSTVIHGIKKIQNLLKENSKITQQLYEIESRL